MIAIEINIETIIVQMNIFNLLVVLDKLIQSSTSWPDVAKSLIVVDVSYTRVPPIFTHFSHGNSHCDSAV